VRKSCEENKQTQAVQDVKGEIADRNTIAQMGTVNSSRTREGKTPKLQAVKSSGANIEDRSSATVRNY